MPQIVPPAITATPAIPLRGTPTFKLSVDGFLSWMQPAVPQFKALVDNAYANAVDAYNSATSASISAAAAGAAAGAIAWVSGTAYVAGNVRYSPTNFASYRRRTNGAGATDPSADAANWAIISNGAGATSAAIKAGASAVDPLTPAATLVAMGFTGYFASGDLAISVSGSFQIAHGLGRKPVLIEAFLRNVTGELGYAPGDVVAIPANAAGGMSVMVNDTALLNVVLNSSTTSTFAVLSRGTGEVGSVTNSKWSLFFRVWA